MKVWKMYFPNNRVLSAGLRRTNQKIDIIIFNFGKKSSSFGDFLGARVTIGSCAQIKTNEIKRILFCEKKDKKCQILRKISEEIRNRAFKQVFWRNFHQKIPAKRPSPSHCCKHAKNIREEWTCQILFQSWKRWIQQKWFQN